MDSQQIWKHHRILIGVLILGFIHGLIYVFTVPPWQHYDEPSHLEYAWLIANGGRIDEKLAQDQRIRREIAASMVENAFFTNLEIQPDLLSYEEPIWIGLPQLTDRPAYYLLVALPLRILRHVDITLQLYVGRLISLLLYIGILVFAYLIVREITGADRAMQWVVPLVLAFNPAFTDLMTAVNNDVGATLAFSIFLFFGVRIIQNGNSLFRILGLSLSTFLCYATKTTVWVAIPMGIVSLVFALRNLHHYGRWALITLLAGMVLSVGIAISTSKDASFWYRREEPREKHFPTRILPGEPLLGEAALQIVASPGKPGEELFQPLSGTILSNLAGETVTVGAWIWSSESIEVNLPSIWTDKSTTVEKSRIGQTPKYYAYQAQIPVGIQRLHLTLNPRVRAGERPITIFYDGLVLVSGAYPIDQNPEFTDPFAGSGQWDGRHFTNLLRNPSGESTWVTFPAWLDRKVRESTPISINRLLTTLQDTEAFGRIYRSTLVNLFQSFWGRFGWNHIRLSSPWYWGLALMTAIAGLGCVFWLINQWPGQSGSWKAALVWLFLSGFIVWFQALARPVFPFWNQPLFIPSARYVFPAAIPTILFITAGWVFILKLTREKWVGTVILLTTYMALDIAALWTIVNYYKEI